jgi:hypothetical protein
MKQVREQRSNRLVVINEEMDPQLLVRFVALLTFRLGGQQSFTLNELHSIQNTVAGVTIQVKKNAKSIVTCRTAESLNRIFPK